jgi:hypothetical protein
MAPTTLFAWFPAAVAMEPNPRTVFSIGTILIIFSRTGAKG